MCGMLTGNLYLQPALYSNNYMDIHLSTCSNVYCVHVWAVRIPVWAAYCQWHHKFETASWLMHSTIQTEVDGVPMYLSGFVLILAKMVTILKQLSAYNHLCFL